MGDLIKAGEYLEIPAIVLAALIGLFLILQIIGEILEFKGKIVPEFLKIRKYFKRKKEEKNKSKVLLEKVQQTLDEINVHYSADNIAKRNEWMSWVNSRAEVYDAALKELTSMRDGVASTNELMLDLYINFNRNRIIDFASKVINENVAVSREEFNRIFKVYNEYEEILEQHGKTNGEVEVSISIIRESYETHMRNHTFVEDYRGYNNNDNE